ncbi:MAG: 2-C-methyl-D-erythritol 2,4-cyclodiphosphate synthase [Atribacterota bacterium]|jgi:2-C-methyl-D-erythritol 2,4-cyclodiphosphate synthase|nr:2-C-methyl-D-erythritol 2,4-cyclodiphosphate synthase [Atribacterota bacterium]MDD3030865.1 2-C-methyl-D-erythritol 2,4-cyclodiphosphate synthase [Atribacterota bacterium]MDD3640325.1 2-C-methyl-D-erythritol 2,4-cyclodiphosphate synthase [Atribacterota bacterium]MDD4288166.1 2-C-methyl-D-erythritol 2,4-cyclodiphosphate synthase [Atribacterota bacterium]MDD4764908.1 2-C-methyl-D-erythritol 2,4-cyclodiphosphate synthase [Atribacterota bacterium]
MRVGFGYDIHRLKTGNKLILGGVEIEHIKGLEGHSDADVLIHSVADALLGAAGLEDIGVHFPDSDNSLKGISSLKILKKVQEMLDLKKYAIVNIDVAVVMEKPKLSPYYKRIKENISKVLRLPEDKINIKASTNEGLGFIGKEEGIAAFCVTSLKKKDKIFK